MTTRTKKSLNTRRGVTGGIILLVLVAMFFGTKVVPDSEAAATTGAFDATSFAKKNFDSKIVPAIEKKATDAATLSAAIAADQAAATKQYGVVEGTSAPVFSISFTGTAGDYAAGIMPVDVAGLADGVSIRVQMGPAINGTAVRDASGLVHFPQFTNQIDYQDAGSALNELVKTSVIKDVDPASLSGKTVTITGVFQLINPESYLVTPVKLEVAP